jgi:hypothetical protein
MEGAQAGRRVGLGLSIAGSVGIAVDCDVELVVLEEAVL